MHEKNLLYHPDVDECAQNLDTCSQLCYDTSYSYTCDCNIGYTLSTDGMTCIGKMSVFATSYMTFGVTEFYVL